LLTLLKCLTTMYSRQFALDLFTDVENSNCKTEKKRKTIGTKVVGFINLA